jgi:2'-5' RNA ligase
MLGDKLTRLQELLGSKISSVRWSSSLPFHVTLAFLGDVPDNDLNQVCKGVAEASLPFSCFELCLEGVGVFPSPARPRVLWAGLTATEMTPLADLQKAIVKKVTAIGYRPDDQRFTPHVTLGRIRSDHRGKVSPDLTSILQDHITWSAGTFVVREVVTFASTLTREGLAYAQLARASFAGKKTAPPP